MVGLRKAVSRCKVLRIWKSSIYSNSMGMENTSAPRIVPHFSFSSAQSLHWLTSLLGSLIRTSLPVSLHIEASFHWSASAPLRTPVVAFRIPALSPIWVSLVILYYVAKHTAKNLPLQSWLDAANKKRISVYYPVTGSFPRNIQLFVYCFQP